jgi:hypothetical protein
MTRVAAAVMIVLGFKAVATAAASPRELLLVPLAEALADRGDLMLIGGKEAKPGDYSASFQARAGDRICTWFLVGPHVLLGAAHCVAGANSTEQIAEVQLLLGNKMLNGNCAISSGYWKDRSQDWTACLIKEAMPVPGIDGSGVVGFEVLGARTDALAVDMKVELSGYGCITPDGARVTGYRIGRAAVTELPPDVLLPRAISKTPNAIKLAQDPAILCEGDSGGPAFLYRDNIRRVVIGINSQTLIRSRISFLASVSTAQALNFFNGWAKANQVTICGLHSQATNCRPF